MNITAYSAGQLYSEAIWNFHTIRNVGSLAEEDTRAGKVYALAEPVVLELANPMNRVLWEDTRNPNPFFHFMEILWNIAGDASSEWIGLFNKNILQFAEDEGYFHGAYGQRWRFTFGVDQLVEVAKMLRKDPTTRRALINMWSPALDLGADKRDIPCNFAMSFRVHRGHLNGYVYNRSNDLIWGMLGTNVVTFSAILEMMARLARLEIGRLYQISSNVHMYERHWPLLDTVPNVEEIMPCDYMFPFLHQGDKPEQVLALWRAEICAFMDGDLTQDYELNMLNGIARPMYQYYVLREEQALNMIEDEAWRVACKGWDGKNRNG